MNNKPYTISEITEFFKDRNSVKIPRFLFQGDFDWKIPAQAKIFFALMLEYYLRSEENGWIDESGIPYILCHRKEMGNIMCCRENSVDYMKKFLNDMEIFKYVHVGKCTWRIYLLHPESE